MAINSLHPLYQQAHPFIKRTVDVYNGDVHDYIPRLAGQSQTEYDAYRTRSSFYNVVERTLAALVGALTRRPHTIENVVGDDPYFYGNVGSDEFVAGCYNDILKTGRVGILVDYDDVAQHPYITSYSGENIINWGDGFIVLAENYFGPDPEDHYNQILLTRYRELMLSEEGFYAVRIWEQKQGTYGTNQKPQYEIVDVIEPMIRGQRLTAIPFTVVNPGSIGIQFVAKPPLSTMADINLDHFKIAVDIGHGAHYIALPTPYIAGDLANEASSIRIGSDQFIHLAPGGSVGYLEFTGAGMNFLMTLQTSKEEQMYSLGSRMLQYKKGVESSDSLQIRLGAESASLVGIAIALEEGLWQALYHYNMWMGFDTEPEVVLNKDVSPTVIDPQQVSSLLALYQQGVITLDTLLQRLYEGEIVDDPNEEKENVGVNEGEEQPPAPPQQEEQPEET